MKAGHELLIVDDNPADIALACEALKACAYQGRTNCVPDGVEALAYLTRRGNYPVAKQPDLVLLDLNLPKRGGLAVLTAMKASPELRRIPVVIFTTSQLSRDVSRSYELGANCYVSKPGNLTEFFSMMRSIEQFWFGSVTLPPRGEESTT
jgi:chemotaxis family two-component system response regulator Rcp1